MVDKIIEEDIIEENEEEEAWIEPDEDFERLDNEEDEEETEDDYWDYESMQEELDED